MFGSDRGHGKYVSVCDILCIVGKLLERVAGVFREDAAPLVLPFPCIQCAQLPLRAH